MNTTAKWIGMKVQGPRWTPEPTVCNHPARSRRLKIQIPSIHLNQRVLTGIYLPKRGNPVLYIKYWYSPRWSLEGPQKSDSVARAEHHLLFALVQKCLRCPAAAEELAKHKPMSGHRRRHPPVTTILPEREHKIPFCLYWGLKSLSNSPCGTQPERARDTQFIM